MKWLDPKKYSTDTEEVFLAIIYNTETPILILKRYENLDYFYSLLEWGEYLEMYVEDPDLKKYYEKDIIAWIPLEQIPLPSSYYKYLKEKQKELEDTILQSIKYDAYPYPSC